MVKLVNFLGSDSGAARMLCAIELVMVSYYYYYYFLTRGKYGASGLLRGTLCWSSFVDDFIGVKSSAYKVTA